MRETETAGINWDDFNQKNTFLNNSIERNYINYIARTSR